MGASLTKEEEMITSMWKQILKKRGVKLEESMLQKMLLWSKKQGYNADIVTSFSVSNWKEIGDRLFDSASHGDEESVSLLTTWGLLFDSLKDFKKQRDRAEDLSALASRDEPPFAEDLLTEQEDFSVLTADPDSAPLSPFQHLNSGDTVTRPKNKLSRLARKSFLVYESDEETDSASPIYKQSSRQVNPLRPSRPAPPPGERGAPAARSAFSRPPVPGEAERGDGPGAGGGEAAASKNRNSEANAEQTSGGSSGKPQTPQAWGSSPAQVTVRPYDPCLFWQKVKQRAMLEGLWDLSEAITAPLKERDPGPATAMTFQGDPGQGIRDEYRPYAWKLIQELQKTVTEYGPNSPATMRLIRLLTMEEMTPYDFAQIAQIMFQPVECTVFRNIWMQRAEAQAIRNLQLPESDPRRGNCADVLTGTGQFSNPQHQAQWHPLVLEQVKAVGLEALMRTAEMAEPGDKYTTIKQGVREPFLQFVEKLWAAVERQVFDDYVKTMLITQLARDNANADCQKIIDALPGEPTLETMIMACAKVRWIDDKMAALAAAMAAMKTPNKVCYKCHKTGHLKPACPNRRKMNGGTAKSAITPAVSRCLRCGKVGHFAKQCQSKYHISGQLLQPGNGRWMYPLPTQ
ncbi:endogenous retrovirus group K member 7 Gag polyprotein-like [Cuculus canorus]|uniref:endogenous retrovirus group K member 7 Gag polyprotein-like n=1 Tax=Cuculus canorus TaxID=55661 RepID=UPI0023AB0D41|nr:endogenous retrovirus group K member 7 Gag polyprotein-like [Cuculus canorus]